MEGEILNHSLKTRLGHSGSPIFALNNNKQVIIIGIHTHKGN